MSDMEELFVEIMTALGVDPSDLSVPDGTTDLPRGEFFVSSFLRKRDGEEVMVLHCEEGPGEEFLTDEYIHVFTADLADVVDEEDDEYEEILI